MTRPLLLCAALALASLATPAFGAGCSREPAPGGDPSVAAATALQRERCRTSAIGDPSEVWRVNGNAFDVEFGAWSFELARVRLQIVPASSPDGETATSFKERTGAIFAINGGFFDFGPNHEIRPVGLFLENGRIKNPLGRGLSGTFLIAGKRVEILPTASVTNLKGFTFGLQSRPMLVEPGHRMGMRSNDGVRLPRSAVCLPDKAHVVFFYAGRTGLNLFELAALLHAPAETGGFGCEVALNLDGGPSTQVAADDDGTPFERSGQNVVNAVVVQAGR